MGSFAVAVVGANVVLWLYRLLRD
ncbi:hypothetical protein [Dickeya oryzae]